MKNQNIVFIAMASALAFALASVTEANTSPQSGLTPESTLRATPTPRPAPAARPANQSASRVNSTSAEDVQLPVITIHSAGNVARGQTGSFVLEMNSAALVGGMYVNFKVSGTAVAGVDYVPLISPAYIGQTGYAVISLKTLPDRRAASSRQAYSVVVTLEPGSGYALGQSSGTAGSISALIWIKP